MLIFIKNLADKDDTARLKAYLTQLNYCIEGDIYLGEVHLRGVRTGTEIMKLGMQLQQEGFEVIFDRKHIICEQVKMVVKEMLAEEKRPRENYSTYISKRIYRNYTYLANIFSEVNGITIEHYIINQKIEQAKKLLLHPDNSIGKVADLVHYSSIGYFSNQFKKLTGLSPSEYKRMYSLEGNTHLS